MKVIISCVDNEYQGYWVSENNQNRMWLCDDARASFHGSAQLNGRNLNIAGKAFLNGEVLSASYWGENSLNGIMLVNLLSSFDILVSWWDVEINEFALNRFDESNLHFTEVFRRVDADDLLESCAIYQNIGGLDWDGSWYDTRYGSGRFYSCDKAGVADGVFSEIGWIEAETQGDIMAGEYYTAGSRDDLDQGSFQIQLTNNGHSFEGFRIINGERVAWKEDRVDATKAYSQQCHIPDMTQTVGGKWFYGKHPSDVMDICILDDGKVEMSYSYNNGDNNGYGIGVISDSGPHSIRITWWEEKADGIAMYRIKNPGKLTEFFWEDVGFSFDIDYEICDDDEVNFEYWGRHSVNTLRLMSPFQDERACARNRELFNTQIFDLESGASPLIISSTLLLCFLWLI